jgi:SNF2 family DNA or RNA helicase
MSTKVRLEYEQETETLSIFEADANVIRNPLFAAFFRGAGGLALPNGTLQIKTKNDELSQRYQTIEKILHRIGVKLDKETQISSALIEIEKEEQRFVEFSKQAHDIWYGQIETEELRSFTEVVHQVCTGRTLYRKQLLAAFHLAFAQNACNFSVPGAGKTSVVYAAYAYLKNLPKENPKAVDRLLIVGPLASFKAWEDEYAEIFKRKPLSKRISGVMPTRERSDYLKGIAHGARDIEITLTSYQTLANSEDDFRIFLSRPGCRTMMVLDEAHYVKNEDGFWAAAALNLAPLATSRIVLTGTPAPNGYEDLANLFKFIYPDRQIIGFPSASLRAMTDGAMSRAVPELKASIRPFYTRIRKSDLNLPDAREHRIAVPMHDAQERIYRSLERRIVPQLRQDLDSPNAPLRVKARIIRLRQASVNPELLLRPLEDEGIFDTAGTGNFTVSELEVADLIRAFQPSHDLARLSTCYELAIRILKEQKKVLIWSYFIGNLQRLKNVFQNEVPFVELLTGMTPVSGVDADDEPALGSREEIIDRFHHTSQPAVLIANPPAVGESISLHKACRSAIYFDRDFNAGRYIQSKDRIHRYNPERAEEVNYYHLICPNTVDEDIDTRLLTKERRLSDLVDSEEIPLLTGDFDDAADIRAILESYERRKTN